MAELDRLLDTIAALPPGRLATENTDTLTIYRSWHALDLIPVRSDGRVQVLDTLYAESSATTPFIYQNMSLISAEAAQRIPNLKLGSPADFDRGIAQLRLLGVRYLLVSSDEIAAHADAESSLRRVADLPTLTEHSIRWRLFEIDGASLVAPLTTSPVVTGNWSTAAQDWFLHGDLSRLPAASGPAAWQKPSSSSLPVVAVSDVVSTGTEVSFTVSRPGVPVLVKMSSFPGCAEGADGPYRAGPNLMVVVPTDSHVRLSFEHGGAEWAGRLLTVAGLGGLIGLWLWRLPAEADVKVTPERAVRPPGRSRPSPHRRGPSRRK